MDCGDIPKPPLEQYESAIDAIGCGIDGYIELKPAELNGSRDREVAETEEGVTLLGVGVVVPPPPSLLTGEFLSSYPLMWCSPFGGG